MSFYFKKQNLRAIFDQVSSIPRGGTLKLRHPQYNYFEFNNFVDVKYCIIQYLLYTGITNLSQIHKAYEKLTIISHADYKYTSLLEV